MSDDVLYFVERVQEAGGGREIAGLLLRVPDAIVLSHGVQLMAECERKRFRAGATFLTYRAAALSAVRDVHGMLPASMGFELEAWRETFSRFAAGHQTLPDFMRGTDGGSAPD
jgi:hypothetical protein